MRCSWCGIDAKEAAKRHEGPHATWSFHFRESQRGGIKPKCEHPLSTIVPSGTRCTTCGAVTSRTPNEADL